MTSSAFTQSQAPGLAPKIKAVLREPLFHFLMLGAAIFALNAIIAPAIPPEKKIEVTAGLRKSISDTFLKDRGRAPTAQELKDLVDTWVLNEITYREALSQGFDKGDEMIRDRISQKMRLLIFSNVTVGEPTKAQLQNWLDTHRARYDVPERASFFDLPMGASEEEADKTLALINAGKEPETVRLRARSFPDRPLNTLAGAFSQEYIAELPELPLHKWTKLESSDGWHIVRVEATVPARHVSVEDVADPLTQEWKEAQARANAVAQVRKMGKNYVILGLDQP